MTSETKLDKIKSADILNEQHVNRN